MLYNKSMKISILCVGKIKEEFYTKAIAEYSKRLSRYCRLEIIQVADEKTPDNASEKLEEQIKAKEGERLLDKIPDDAYVIALAIEGKEVDSVSFSKQLNELTLHGNSHIVFVIGGSLGLTPAVLNRANYLLSFSKMTFPHQLMRVILLEQVYRAFRIQNNEPYHK